MNRFFLADMYPLDSRSMVWYGIVVFVCDEAGLLKFLCFLVGHFEQYGVSVRIVQADNLTIYFGCKKSIKLSAFVNFKNLIIFNT